MKTDARFCSLGTPETSQKAQVEYPETGEDRGRRRGPCGNPPDQLDHDKEEVRAWTPPHTACPLPSACWVLGESTLGCPRPLLPTHHRHPYARPPRRPSQDPA